MPDKPAKPPDAVENDAARAAANAETAGFAEAVKAKPRRKGAKQRPASKRGGKKPAAKPAKSVKPAEGAASPKPRRSTKQRKPPRQTFLVAATIAAGDGPPRLRVYAVVVRGPAEALDAVRAEIGPDIPLELTGKLSNRMSKALGLKADEVRPV